MPSVEGMTPSILRRLGRDTQYVLLGFPLGLIAVVVTGRARNGAPLLGRGLGNDRLGEVLLAGRSGGYRP